MARQLHHQTRPPPLLVVKIPAIKPCYDNSQLARNNSSVWLVCCSRGAHDHLCVSPAPRPAVDRTGTGPSTVWGIAFGSDGSGRPGQTRSARAVWAGTFGRGNLGRQVRPERPGWTGPRRARLELHSLPAAGRMGPARAAGRSGVDRPATSATRVALVAGCRKNGPRPGGQNVRGGRVRDERDSSCTRRRLPEEWGPARLPEEWAPPGRPERPGWRGPRRARLELHSLPPRCRRHGLLHLWRSRSVCMLFHRVDSVGGHFCAASQQSQPIRPTFERLRHGGATFSGRDVRQG